MQRSDIQAVGDLAGEGSSVVPFLPHANCHFVASAVAPPLLGMIAGDHRVRSRSAAGRGKSRRIPFDAAHGLTLTGLNHLDLLNHPLVYAKLWDWLTQSPAVADGQTGQP